MLHAIPQERSVEKDRQVKNKAISLEILLLLRLQFVLSGESTKVNEDKKAQTSQGFTGESVMKENTIALLNSIMYTDLLICINSYRCI